MHGLFMINENVKYIGRVPMQVDINIRLLLND